MLENINFLAVVGAGIVAMGIGFAWYSPVLFGKRWLALSGVSPDTKGKSKEQMIKSTLIGFIAALVTAFVLSLFVNIAGATSMYDALLLAFLVWVGFTATIQVGVVLWEGKPWRLFLINTTHSFVSIALMTIILTFFR
jgi:hypothetical protein